MKPGNRYWVATLLMIAIVSALLSLSLQEAAHFLATTIMVTAIVIGVILLRADRSSDPRLH